MPSVSGQPLYLDYNATTPIDSRVLAAMLPYLQGEFGNPSSHHVYGTRARAAVDQAREQAASFLGTAFESIVFTCGGTEANNHAISGAARLGRARGRHLLISAVEHAAVSNVCRHLSDDGCETTAIGVDADCLVDAAVVAAALRPSTVLVSVMHANNEVGTVQPIGAIAEAARRSGALSHTDAAQSAGKIPVRMDDLGVDLLSIAGHKLYAAKGVGILCIRPGIPLPAFMHGAGHEAGRRPGTENVAAIVGLGLACEIAGQTLTGDAVRLARWRDGLAAQLQRALPGAHVHAGKARRIPNTLSIGFPGVAAADILKNLPDVAVSAGAACHDGGAVVSHVLQAMGVAPDLARGTLRISLGRSTDEKDMEFAAAAIIRAVRAAGARHQA